MFRPTISLPSFPASSRCLVVWSAPAGSGFHAALFRLPLPLSLLFSCWVLSNHLPSILPISFSPMNSRVYVDFTHLHSGCIPPSATIRSEALYALVWTALESACLCPADLVDSVLQAPCEPTRCVPDDPLWLRAVSVLAPHKSASAKSAEILGFRLFPRIPIIPS